MDRENQGNREIYSRVKTSTVIALCPVKGIKTESNETISFNQDKRAVQDGRQDIVRDGCNG